MCCLWSFIKLMHPFLHQCCWVPFVSIYVLAFSIESSARPVQWKCRWVKWADIYTGCALMNTAGILKAAVTACKARFIIIGFICDWFDGIVIKKTMSKMLWSYSDTIIHGWACWPTRDTSFTGFSGGRGGGCHCINCSNFKVSNIKRAMWALGKRKCHAKVVESSRGH